MRVAALSAIALQIFSASSTALAKVDDDSPLIPDFVLADIGDKASALYASNLPSYCYDYSDYECYKKGVPKCCTGSHTCTSSDKPGCDRSGTRTHTSGLLDYCFDNRDYKCYKDGVPRCCTKSKPNCKSDKTGCRGSNISNTVIRKDGVCRAGVDVCVKGTACINGRCSIPTIPAGGVCYNGDVCVIGYFCNNGRCERKSRRIIRGGGVCQPGDICETGYACINNRCSTPTIPAGGFCNPVDDVCVSGYFCNNGRCDPTTRIIPRNGICQTGDICEAGFTCVGGRCSIPPIPRGGVCNQGDVCADGSVCLNGVCSTASWYTNWQYCVMDCPASASPCCGGYAQSWDQAYGSADACCSQSAFNGNKDGCLNKSLQCSGEEIAKSD